jgi:N-sulfoglucosamine sulfohydrolase
MADTKNPNIVLIVADDLGREALGCYGNKVIKTPNIDSLAEDGVKFENSFCTTASCAASRSVILTGLHNHTNGTFGHTHDIHHFSCYDNVRTLPMMLNENGYRTGRIGKKHYAPEDKFPFQWNGNEEFGDRNDVAKAETCRPFMSADEPFFLYWCSHNPHRAGIIREHPFEVNSFGNPEESFSGDTEQIYSEDDVEIPPFLNDNPEARADLAQYYQSISRFDRGVGRLIDILKETGKYENTLIICISDNGAAFPQAKTTLYEPGMRLPCVVHVPGAGNSKCHTNGLITWADITPTVLDYAGSAESPENFFGDSLRPLLEGDDENWRDEIYASHTFHEITNYYPMRVIRTGKFKFIWNIAWKLDYSFGSDLWKCSAWQREIKENTGRFGMRKTRDYIHRPRFELYDIENDPYEINNLATDEKYKGQLSVFIDKMKHFQEETSDPWLHKWIYE